MIINGVHYDRGPESLTTLLNELEIPDRGVAVAVNGDVIPRSTWSGHIVGADDVVEIVTAAAGGF